MPVSQPAAQAGGKKKLQASERKGWVGGGEILSKIQDGSKCPAGCKMQFSQSAIALFK